MARKGYKTATFTLPDGTRKYVYAKTQEELDEKVFNLKLQMKMGVDLQDKTTVGELIKLWYTTEVEPNIQQSTAITMKSVLNNHLLPMCTHCVAKEVTPVQIKMWLNETGKLNKHAARLCLRALREAFGLAEENGLVYKSPVLRRYKPGGTEYKHRKALSVKAEESLLDAVEGTRVYLLVWTGLATGARRGELLGLKWDCVDLENAVIHIRRNLVFVGRSGSQLNDYTKTESGVRELPLPWDLCLALRELRSKSNSMFVFPRADGQPFAANDFSYYWRTHVHQRFGPEAKDSKRIHGVKHETVVTPHVLRHTYATRCFEAGLDIKEVQRLMGHATPEITLAIYTHYCEESRKDSTFEKARTARSRTTAVPHKDEKGTLENHENAENAVHASAM